MKPRTPDSARPDPLDPSGEDLLQQVLRGERVLLFPPGAWVFVCVQLCLLVGAGLFLGEVVTSLFVGPKTIAVAMLIGLAVLAPLLIVPGVLVTRGWSRGRPALMWIAAVLLIGSLILAIVRAAVGRGLESSELMSSALFLAALLLLRSRSYRVLAGYYRAKRDHAISQRERRRASPSENGT